MASIGALLDHLARAKAVSNLDEEGIEGLDIRDIEILSLQDSFLHQMTYIVDKSRILGTR
jgi:hypothetical protein